MHGNVNLLLLDYNATFTAQKTNRFSDSASGTRHGELAGQDGVTTRFAQHCEGRVELQQFPFENTEDAALPWEAWSCSP